MDACLIHEQRQALRIKYDSYSKFDCLRTTCKFTENGIQINTVKSKMTAVKKLKCVQQNHESEMTFFFCD